jgi:hypothetical protein
VQPLIEGAPIPVSERNPSDVLEQPVEAVCGWIP